MVNPSIQLELRVFIDKYRELLPPFVMSSLCAIMTMDEDQSKKEIEHLKRLVADQSANIDKLRAENTELANKLTAATFPQHELKGDVKMLPDDYTQEDLIEILRNPYGWTPSSIRTAMGFGADALDNIFNRSSKEG